MTVPRRLALALAISALCHGGVLVLGLGFLGVSGRVAEGLASGRRFAVAVVERAGDARSAATGPERAVERRAPPARRGDAQPAATDAKARAGAPRREVGAKAPESRPVAVGESVPAAVRRASARRLAPASEADTAAPVATTGSQVSERGQPRKGAADEALTAVHASAADRGSPDGAAGDAHATMGGSGAPAPRLASTGPAGQGAAGGGLDLRPWCRACPAPDYPVRARRRGWQGTVDVDLAIESDGSVGDARVVRSSGFPTLDEAAVAVARQSRFRLPAGGGARRGKLRYQFRLEQPL